MSAATNAGNSTTTAKPKYRTNSCNSNGVPRISSTHAVNSMRTRGGPYTRPLAINTPAATASAMDRQDSTNVTTAARPSAGRYRRAASHPLTDGADGCSVDADVFSPFKSFAYRRG